MDTCRPAPTDAQGGSAASIRTGFVVGMASLLLLEAAPAQVKANAQFGAASPAADVRQLANWIAHTGDHQGRAFFLVDKVHATLYAFDLDARLLASTPVLLGAAVGDDSVPGIGTRPMARILPSERTTPAGRFVAEAGRNLQGEGVVWVDHTAAVSMHRVRSSDPLERRAERLGSATTADNRISYGCINVPPAFYERHVRAAFAANPTAVVYVLPETRSLQEQFGVPLSGMGEKR